MSDFKIVVILTVDDDDPDERPTPRADYYKVPASFDFAEAERWLQGQREARQERWKKWLKHEVTYTDVGGYPELYQALEHFGAELAEDLVVEYTDP